MPHCPCGSGGDYTLGCHFSSTIFPAFSSHHFCQNAAQAFAQPFGVFRAGQLLQALVDGFLGGPHARLIGFADILNVVTFILKI